MQMQLSAVHWQWRHVLRIRMEQRAIDTLHELRELLVIGRLDDEDAAGLAGREPAVVEVITIHRDERAPQIVREPVMAHVRRAAQFVFFEHEQHVPMQTMPHVSDEAGRHVGVRVDARPRR